MLMGLQCVMCAQAQGHWYETALARLHRDETAQGQGRDVGRVLLDERMKGTRTGQPGTKHPLA